MDIEAIGRILCGAVVSILAYILMYKARNWLSSARYSISLLIGGIFALVLTWYLLFWFMTLTMGRILAPWDQWASFAPPKDTWQRQLNDFSSQDSSQYLIALVIVGISGTLFLAGMFRDINNVRGKLPLAFAITNLAFLLVGFVSVILGNRLPDLWLPQPHLARCSDYRRSTGAALLGSGTNRYTVILEAIGYALCLCEWRRWVNQTNCRGWRGQR